MRKIVKTLLYAFAACGFVACKTAPSIEQQAADKLNEISKAQNAIGLSVAVVKDNNIIYTGAVGLKNIEDSTLLSTDDIFRIASISKSFTATAIMQLHEAGKFGLDDDVSNALGIKVRNPKFPDKPITYRMLLTHTSSLNDTTGYFNFDVIDETVNKEYWRAYNDYEPGTTYQYCNLGFNMLGALVELHSGERFDEYIDNHIVKPLGLYAGYNVDKLDAAKFVSIYNFEDGKPVASPDAYKSRAKDLENYTMGRTTPIFSPTGGMKIAPKDLAKHMMVQMNAGTYNNVQILKPESVTAMQTPVEHPDQDEYYGFAIETTTKLIEGETLKGHTGSAYGLYSAMYFSPEKKFGIIMMTNGYPVQNAPNGFRTIQSDVVNVLYDLFIKDKKQQ